MPMQKEEVATIATWLVMVEEADQRTMEAQHLHLMRTPLRSAIAEDPEQIRGKWLTMEHNKQSTENKPYSNGSPRFIHCQGLTTV